MGRHQRVVRRQKRTRAYYLAVGFDPPGGGPPVTVRQRVTRATHDAVSTGQPVTVVFDPAKPSRAVVYEYGDWELAPARLG